MQPYVLHHLLIFWRAGCGERVPIGEMVEFRILSNSMKNAKQTVDSDESDQWILGLTMLRSTMTNTCDLAWIMDDLDDVDEINDSCV